MPTAIDINVIVRIRRDREDFGDAFLDCGSGWFAGREVCGLRCTAGGGRFGGMGSRVTFFFDSDGGLDDRRRRT